MSTAPRIRLMVVAAAMASGLCGCSYPYPDCEPERVGVRFDWSLAPDADPEGMGILFYPIDGRSYWRYDLRPSGGSVDLTPGSYDILSLNNDTESLLLEDNDRYSTFCLTTRPATLTSGLALASRSGAEPILMQPDEVWVATLPSRQVTYEDTITLTPRPMTARFDVTVGRVDHPESAAQTAMAISGLSAARVLTEEGPAPQPATLPGSIALLPDSTMAGTLLSFGDCPDRADNVLSIYFWLRDGQKLLYQFDVGPQVMAAADPMHVRIHVDLIQLPETQGPAPDESAGMDVGVDQWETIEIELSN